MDRSYILIGTQALLAGLLLAGTALESSNGSLMTFWFPLIAFACFTYYSTSESEENRTKDIMVLLFIATVSVSSVLLLPGVYRLDKDAHFEFQYASTIIENGYIKVSDGLGYAKDYYGNNPPIHLLISEFSLLTGVPAINITKYLMLVLIRMNVSIIAFLIFKEVCRRFRINENYSYLGAIVFCASYGLLTLGISRRSIAIIFLLLLIHTALNGLKQARKISLALLFSALVILSDHSVAYMLIFSSFCLFAFYTFFLMRRGSITDSTSVAILGLAVFCLAVFIVSRGDAFYLYSNEYDYAREFAGNFQLQKTLNREAISSGQHLGATQYQIKSVITLSSQIVFYLLALPGCISFYRRFKALPESDRAIGNVFLALFLIAFIAFPVMIYLLRTNAAVYTQPFMWLPYMMLSLCFVHTIEGLRKKWAHSFLIVLSILVLIVMGNFLLSFSTSVLANKDASKISLEDYQAKTDELYYSGKWLRESLGDKYALVDGDPTVFDIYGPFFGIEVSGEWWINSFYSANDSEYSRLLLENRTVYTKMRGNYPQRADYIVTNRLVYSYPSSYLGDNKKFYSLERFDNTSALDSVYDNRQIQIRRIDYGQAAG